MDKLQRLKELYKQKKSYQFYAERLSKEFNELVTVEDIKELLKGEEKIVQTKNSFTEDLNSGKAELTAVLSKEIKTLDELIKYTNINTNIWNVDKYIQNFWGNEGNPSYQVKAWLSKIKTQESEVIKNLLENYKSSYKPISQKEVLTNKSFTNESCMVLSLCDFHIDKLDVGGCDVEKRIEEYNNTIDTLLYRSYHSHNLEQIIFVIGNDYFQTDSYHGTTVSGTKVDVGMEWDKAYERGFDLMVNTINKLKQFCKKLHIVLTPGNHSKTKEFYMVHALEVFFKTDSNITFDRTSNDLKVFTYGETALFFNHGNNINDKLPLVFATTFYKEWGECKFKEIILGDKHHNSEKSIRTQGEAQGVRMRIMPATCGTDRWHLDNLFTNAIKAGVALIYDKNKGKISEFEHRI